MGNVESDPETSPALDEPPVDDQYQQGETSKTTSPSKVRRERKEKEQQQQVEEHGNACSKRGSNGNGRRNGMGTGVASRTMSKKSSRDQEIDMNGDGNASMTKNGRRLQTMSSKDSYDGSSTGNAIITRMSPDGKSTNSNGDRKELHDVEVDANAMSSSLDDWEEENEEEGYHSDSEQSEAEQDNASQQQQHRKQQSAQTTRKKKKVQKCHLRAEPRQPMDQKPIEVEEINEREEDVETIDIETLHGYRIMKVFLGSPAEEARLNLFEDFIIAVNNVLIEDEEEPFGQALAKFENKKVSLLVWSCVHRMERLITLTPRRWQGPGLLGAVVKRCSLENPIEHVYHVLSVKNGSPANTAALMPQSDFIVGTMQGPFETDQAFETAVKQADRKEAALHLIVFSSATGKFRETQIHPNSHWGGGGSLGCDVGTGILHRIPVYSNNHSDSCKLSIKVRLEDDPTSGKSVVVRRPLAKQLWNPTPAPTSNSKPPLMTQQSLPRTNLSKSYITTTALTSSASAASLQPQPLSRKGSQARIAKGSDSGRENEASRLARDQILSDESTASTRSGSGKKSKATTSTSTAKTTKSTRSK